MLLPTPSKGIFALLACLLSFAVLSNASAQTTGFSCTGGSQYYTVPAGVYSLTFEAAGASGGDATGTPNPGKGGLVTGTIKVTPGDFLTITVGGAGKISGAGGFNGGGNGTLGVGGGGGGTSINSNTAGLLVFAGGGGGGYQGGDGGGSYGGTAGNQGNGSTSVGGGGSYFAGGAGGTSPLTNDKNSNDFGSNGGYEYGGNGAVGVTIQVYTGNDGNGNPVYNYHTYGGGGGGAGIYGGGGGTYNYGGGGGASYIATSFVASTSDIQGNRNGDGFVNITPIRTPPINALNFDGNSTYVSANLPLTNINSFTVEAWISPSVLNVNQGFFTYGSDNGSSGNGMNLFINNTGGLVLNLPGQASYATGYTFPTAGRWYHVALTRGNGVNNVYVDGKLVFTDSHVPTTPTAFVLGAHSGTRYFNGNIDEFKFYNTALTAAQIFSDAYDTSIAVRANLVAYYNFDEGCYANGNNPGYTTLTDRSINSYNGTLHNFILNGSSSNWVESFAMVVPMLTSATNIAYSSFRANWNLPKEGVINNIIFDLSTSSNFSSFVSGYPTTSPLTIFQDVTNLLPSTTYYYRVRASLAGVTSSGGYYGYDSIITPAPLPPTITSFSPTSGAAGTTITITGNYFNNIAASNNLVFFGAIQATVISASATQLTVTVPSAVISSPISVLIAGTNLYGSSLTNFNPYTLSTQTIFNSIGVYTYTVPPDVHAINFQASGAQGADISNTFGKGGLVTGTLGVDPGEILTLVVGGAGQNNGTGGYNGGGSGSNGGGGGGGGSQINSPSAIQVFAGGGGGGYLGGDGGGTTAATAGSGQSRACGVGGSNGSGGDGGNSGYTDNIYNGTSGGYKYGGNAATSYYIGGGGGAGINGGGGGTENFGGGGGASYTNGAYNVVHKQGNTLGNGFVYITPITAPPYNALNFDGNSTYVSANLPLNKINNFTVEAWIQPSVLNVNQGFFTYGADNGSAGDGINLFINNAGALILNLPGQSSYSTGYSFPTANRWYHVALTRGGGINNVYVDGQLVFTDTHTPTTPSAFVLGSHSSTRYFNGNIDEFKFYDTTLSKSQIFSDAYNYAISAPLNLVTYYNFDEGIAGVSNTGITSLFDLSSNAINGTLHNFSLTGSTSNWVESYAMVVPIITEIDTTSITPISFTANWTAPLEGYADNYYLDVSTTSNFSSPITGSPFKSNATSMAVTGLLEGTTYYYRVRASVSSITGIGGYYSYDSVTTVQQPVINSFSPTNAIVGSLVTITGSGFDTNPANNIVFVGATQATVTSATTTQLIVTVPMDATYGTISVLNKRSGLSANSILNFNPIYSPAKTNITNNDFAKPVSYFTGGIGATSVAIGDIDGDGKSDLITLNRYDTSVSVFRNISNIGRIDSSSFANKIDFTTGISPNSIAIGDIDGDGKPDIVVTNSRDNTISVLHNTSTLGNISFAPKVDFSINISKMTIGSLAIGDFDGDGKPDLAVIFGYYTQGYINYHSSVAIFFNTTKNIGIIDANSFAKPSLFDVYPPGNYALLSSIAVNDIDGDGKPDLIISDETNNKVLVLQNQSWANNASFSPPVTLSTIASPQYLTVGDLDGDGKNDLVVSSYNSNTLCVYRNTSTIGSITSSSFGPQVLVYSNFNLGVSIGDFNGDGKPDLLALSNSTNLSILINNSSIGSINTSSFSNTLNLPVSAAGSVAIGDLDGDGKPDIAAVTGLYVSVIRNIVPPPIISSFSPTTAPTGTMVTVKGSNFLNVTGVSFGRVAASSYSVLNDSTITAVVGNGNSGYISITTNLYTDSLAGFNYCIVYTPSVSIALNTNNVCSGTSVTITATGVNEGSAPVYNFLVNGVSVQNASSNTYTRTSFKNGDVVTCIMTANNACQTSATANSNSLTMVVRVPTTATVSVSTSDAFIWHGTTYVSSTGTATFDSLNAAGCDSLTTLHLTIHPPLITSFSPLTATVGSTITITGTGFNTTAANNIVFFGATQATVTAATSTQLTVTVPAGATYAPITVLNKPVNLACCSLSNFNPVYSPAKTKLSILDFSTRVNFTTGTTPINEVIGDIDGDGKPDMVVVNDGANTVSVLRNTATNGSIGSGSFAIKVDFTTGSGPRTVAIGDIDGDGKPDLVVTNYTSNTISVLRNTSTSGTISFATKVDFTTNTSAFGVAIGDIDGDGKLDLAVSNYGSSNVSVYRNLSSIGNISFATHIDFATGSYPVNLAIGDIDGDGIPDISVVNAGSSTVSVLRNLSVIGTVNFATHVDFATGTTPNGLAIGDLDGDGIPDVAVSNYGANTVSVLRNTSTSGTVSFATHVDLATGTGPLFVTIGDISGDGKPDLVVANPGANTVSVLRSVASSGSITTGSFATHVDFLTGSSPYTVTVGDLDGDGLPDMVVTNVGDNTVSVLHQIVPVYPPTITVVNPSSATVGSTVTITGTNFNTTSANNIVFFGATQATVTAATATQLTVTVPAGATYAPITELNSGTNMSCFGISNFNPIYSPAKTNITSTDFATKVDLIAGSGPRTVAIGDLDGDGKPDLVEVNSNTTTISVFRNITSAGTLTSGSFAAKVDFTVGSGPVAVIVGDIDGDGKPDLIVTNGSSNTVSVLRNTSTSGTISFATKVDFTTSTGTFAVAIGDLDGDGKLDLAVSNNSVNNVSILRNTSTIGNISFATHIDFATGTGPLYLAIEDIDGDGMPDISVTNANSNTVSVLRNLSTIGTINFGTHSDFATGSVPISLAVGDLDGDGHPDIVVTNQTSNTISVLYNTSTSGNPSFATKVDFAGGSATNIPTIGDMDGDGKPDIIVCNRTANSVSVFRNTSTSGSITSNSFAGKVDYTVGTSPYSVAVGDLDGDGRPDIVTANLGANTVSILHNTIPAPTISSFSPTTAATGTTVTITGTNFYSATGVSFGSVAATSFTVVSATSITVVVPSGAASGNVVVTTPTGIGSLAGFTTCTNVTPSVSISANPSGSILLGTNVTFTALPTNGGTPSYQWVKNGNNILGATNSTYTTSTLADNDVITVVMTANNICQTINTTTSNNITMSIISAITWTGAVSTDWNTVGNWLVGIPNSKIKAIIPAAPINQPVIGNVENVAVDTVIIQSGATLTNNGILNVYGNFSDSGRLSSGSSCSVVLKGTGTISGSDTFANLEIQGNYAVGASLVDKIYITGILKKTSGTLSTSDKLTLISNASGSALIEENGGALSGKAYIQHYAGGNFGYHHFSSPISDGTVNSWSNAFPITGPDGAPSWLSNWGSLQIYDEVDNGFSILDSGYYNYTATSKALTPGKGYTAWLNSLPTLNTFGTPNNGAISIPVTHSTGTNAPKGWNFVGNPYPSPISWKALKTLNPGLFGDASCYLWKASGVATNGTWTAYDGTVGVNGAGDVINSSLGFFVYVNNSGTLNFNNSVRTYTYTNPEIFGAKSNAANVLRLSIKDEVANTTDEAVAYTSNQAGFSRKMAQPATATNATIAFDVNGTKAAINTLTAIDSKTELPITVLTPRAGTYTVSLSTKNINLPVYLKDAVTGTYTDLSASTTITTTTSETAGRYSLVFKQPTVDRLPLTVYPNPAKSSVVIIGSHIASVQVVDNLGRVVKTVSLKDATNPTLSLGNLPAGAYHLRVQTTDGKINNIGMVKE